MTVGNYREIFFYSIPAELIKGIVKAETEIVLRIMNSRLKDQEFSEKWKMEKLILIPKFGKSEGDTLYRSICLLEDTMGKLYKALIR